MSELATASRRWSRCAKAALAASVAVGLFVIAFDWNWFRPQLERYLSDKSHRIVRIADFRIGLSWSQDATFRLRGVRIENAPWADKRPFIVARELSATCTLASLIRKRPVITRLALVDADVDLERQADGLRNWRLTRPDDRGPGIIKILALEAVRSRLRFVHRGIDLDVQAAAVPLNASAATGSPMTTRIDFVGTYGGAAFAGDALTSRELTFQGTGRSFPIRGHVVSRRTRLDVDGRAADVFNASAVDAHVALQGSSLAQLRPFVGAVLSESPSYKATAHLKKEASQFSFSEAIVKIGLSDLRGALTFDMEKEQHRLRADLRSEVMHIEDLGLGKQIADSFRPPAPALQNAKVAAASRADLPFDSASATGKGSMSSRIRDLDAELRLEVRRLTTAALPMSANLVLIAKLANRVLAITPIDLGVAGGNASGELTVDVGRELPIARVRIKVRNVRIERMFTSLPDKKRVAGAINGNVDMTAHGNSMAALLGSASGSISARMVDGSMSRLLDAELGLSGTRLLRALIGGDDLVPIKCAAADFEFREGRGRARTLLIDTEKTSLEGTGGVDLQSGAIDLLLTPQSDRPGILELHKSIAVRGKPGHVIFSLAEAASQTSGRRCLERKR